MPRCLILGYGNPLRSDDAFGWKAACTLEREVPFGEIRIVAAQQLTPDMAEAVANSPHVLFLDASHDGEPGEIHKRPVQRDPDASLTASLHQLTPTALLELAYQYYGTEPKATLLTVTGENFEFGERLSPRVEAAWNACLEQILGWIRALESNPETAGSINLATRK